MDEIQFVMKSLRKRKRPPCSQGALNSDLPFSGSPIVIHEPSLIPPIVTLTPATTTPTVKVKLFIEDLPNFSQKNLHQDSVTVDQFIRKVAAKVPGPYRGQKSLTRKIKNVHTSSPSSAFIAWPARTKIFSRNQRRVSKTPIKERNPMTLTQRLARAAILSHVKTDNILHSPALFPPLPPLDFVPFQKFATPPSLRKRSTPSTRGESHPKSSAASRRRKRYQKLNHISRQPDSDRSGCLPLSFIPFLEAEDAYAAKIS